MADNITQSLGFDASGALASISQLDGALAAFEARMQQSAAAMREFNSVGNQTSALLSRLATSASRAADAISALSGASSGKIQGFAAAYNNVGSAAASAAAGIADSSGKIKDALDKTADEGKKNVDRLTTSLKLLSRIVFTQAIVRALSTLRNTMKEVGGEAVDFQQKVALIQTIDQSGQSADQLKNSIRGISDAFNIPQLEVAEGLYQTISNQIGEAGESLQFLNTAAKFARATSSSLADSVDLLSGALKSFNLDVTDADRAAGVLFKSIDLGRITADRLANTFGRVGPQSALAGLSLEEFGAAVAAISIKGTNTNEALTQYRGIVTALQKPTQALQQAVQRAGFSSTESAVANLKLAGTLKLLQDSTGGSNNALAAFFPNVRGLGGAAALTGDDLQVLIDDLKEMESATSKTINDKFLTAIGTDAERVTSDINKLKNALTDELGQALLQAAANASEFVGGVDSVVELIRLAPPFIGGMSVSVLGLASAFTAARAAGLKLAPVVSELLLIPAAFGLGKSIGNFIDEKSAKAAFDDVSELIKQDQEQISKFQELTKEGLDEATRADEERIQSARNASREITAAYNEQIIEAQNLNKNLVRSLKSDANDIITSYRQLSSAIGSAIADAEKTRQESLNRIQSLQNEQSQALLKSQLAGLNDAQKVFALSQQSAQLASQAARLIASASGNEGQANRGRQQADLAKQLAEQEASVAQQTGDRGLQAKAAADLSSILNGQIAAEKQLASAEQARESRLAAAKQRVDATTKALQEQFQILLANSGALDKQGKRFTEAEQAQRAANREAASNRIAQLSLNNADTKQLAQLGLGAAVAKLGSQLTVNPLKLAFDADTGITRVQSKITQAFATFKVKLGFDTKGFEDLLGQTFANPEQVFKGLDQAQAQAATIRKQLGDSEVAAKQVAQLRQQANTFLQTAASNAPSPNDFGAAFNAPELDARLRSIITDFSALANQSQITSADIEKAKQAVTDFIDNGTNKSLAGKFDFATVNKGLAAFVISLEQLAQVQQKALNPTEASNLKAQLQQIDGLLSGINANNIGESLRSGSAALQSAVSPAETIATSSATVKANYEKAAQAIIRASQASPGGAQGFATGGLVRYYADGGFTPRGTDTIPAMLSPGEFVVNAAATRKFYAQLVAINSGRQPIYRAEGGPTTTQNFHFGDINVVSGSSKTPGRAVVDEVRRELRRATSKL